MSILTIWTTPSNQVQVVQLSDDPEDGTPSEQISYLATLKPYAGLMCVAQNYIGAFPATDAVLWRWVNGAVVAAAAAAPVVVSMRQARLALLQSGLLAQVDAAIAVGSEAGRITWEYATEVRREDALVANLSVALGLTESQLDGLFTLAGTL